MGWMASHRKEIDKKISEAEGEKKKKKKWPTTTTTATECREGQST